MQFILYYSFKTFLFMIGSNPMDNIHHNHINQLVLNKSGKSLQYVENDINTTRIIARNWPFSLVFSLLWLKIIFYQQLSVFLRKH